MTMCTVFPACYIEIPESSKCRRAPFFLAAEEYVAKKLPPCTYLFSWQVPPTVVMGRNQIVHHEIDINFCHEHHIDIVRRKSGGGTIFADNNNIMWSLITTSGAVEPLFADYAHHITSALNKIGIQVQVSGRNDIILQNAGKVCGNAFYRLPRRNIVHGTMLYDTQTDLMLGALKPDMHKMNEKGVKSVHSRIGLLKEYTDISISDLRLYLRNELCNRYIQLTPTDLKRIEELEDSYHQSQFIFGHAAHTDIIEKQRIPQCGTLELHISLKGTLIKDISLYGDYFELAPSSEIFKSAFLYIPFTLQAISEVIETKHPEKSIRGLTADHLRALFANLLTE